LIEASQFLAALSHCAGVVVAPSEPEGKYKHIEFVRLRGRQVLIIFVTNTGSVQNKLIELDESIQQHDLNTFSVYLDEELERHTLTEIRQRLTKNEEENASSCAMEHNFQPEAGSGCQKVHIGASDTENPEFANVERR
jgi:heat-inducible transcriptional repressor